MLSHNFFPLSKNWPSLYEHANKAEQYIYSDPHAAVIKLRCYAELLVGELYKELKIFDLEVDDFYNRLTHASFVKAVPCDVIEKFHAIRKHGNSAAHGKNIPPEQSVRLIEEAYLIGQWFYKTLTKDDAKYPAFVQPPLPTTGNGKNTPPSVSLAQTTSELRLLQEKQEQELADLKATNTSVDTERLKKFIQDGHQVATEIDLQPDKTAQLFNFEDAFAEYELSPGQRELVQKLDIFLKGKDHNVFLLKGYAGTGKTFITKGLTEHFSSIGRNFVLAAPTGKAAKVIAKKTGFEAYTIHKTIYSFKGLKEYRDENITGTETFKFYAELAVNTRSVDTVYIVDEASMLSDKYQESEFLRFGSGFLLKDFFNFVNLDHNDHRKKVIFIGDNAQLPPVGMDSSPALNAVYLHDEYHVNVTEYLLTNVVRQKSESGILKNASALRKLLDSQLINQLTMFFSQDSQRIEYDALIDGYIQACGKKINDNAILIAHSNADVRMYNNCVREYFFPGHPDEIMPGDKIMATNNNNNYGFFISNGDFGIVRNVFGSTESRTIPLKRKNNSTNQVEEINVVLRFRNVEVGFRDSNNQSKFFNAKIIENLLYSDSPDLSSDENKALYVDFCIRNKGLKRNSQEFKDTLRSDPYFTALRVKFGYAITCHKAQGSEWKHVFVKCKNSLTGLNVDYVRWLYTAITRAVDTLYMADPPDFKLGSGIRIISRPGMDVSAAPITPTPSAQNPQEDTEISATQPSPPNVVSATPPQNTFGISPLDTVLLGILHAVQKCLSDNDILIIDIGHNSYQEAYFFQRGSESARVNIGYKGNGKVGSLSAPVRSELANALLLLLEPLKGKNLPNTDAPTTEISSCAPFLQEFHARLSTLAVGKNITVRCVEPLQWRLRYTFIRDNEEIVFDVLYNGKQQFTYAQPVSNTLSFPSLMKDVTLLLTEGLS